MYIFVRGFLNGLMVFFMLKVLSFAYEKESHVNIKEVSNQLEIAARLAPHIKFQISVNFLP